MPEMRVIAGTVRGVRLAAPRGIQTRPTADRVREALFSYIAARCDVDGIRVLDICAGTGSLGIEALSRGAGYCCFVERDRRALAALEQNLGVTGLRDRAETVPLDLLKALRLLARQGQTFDLILFDPPYASPLYGTVLELLDRSGLLADKGLLVAEAAAKSPLPERIGGLFRIDRRLYGDTALEFYRRIGNRDGEAAIYDTVGLGARRGGLLTGPDRKTAAHDSGPRPLPEER
jgi:16S rRNA (guanine(966)-N(2))-methyltransferase RsmD